jgi:hypothetical protein
MIGEIPTNEEFKKLFNWPDAVIQLPFGSNSIDSIMRELDNNPEREKIIHKNNVIHALRQHDWVYRWEEVLKIAGLEPLTGLNERKERLQHLSKKIETETRSLA